MTINITLREKELAFFRLKDPVSALTHFAAFILSILSSPILIMKGAADGLTLPQLFSLSIYSTSMILLYGASSAYHSFNLGEKRNTVLRKLDHGSIGILVAGTYAPLCTIALESAGGRGMLLAVSMLAIAALLLKLFWIDCPPWVSSVLYLLMGWTCAPHLISIRAALGYGFRPLLLGGIAYSLGAVIYAAKIPYLEKNRNFRSHELFHIFIMAGSFFHFLMIYVHVA